jgi:hypothetical protein
MVTTGPCNFGIENHTRALHKMQRAVHRLEAFVHDSGILVFFKSLDRSREYLSIDAENINLCKSDLLDC